MLMLHFSTTDLIAVLCPFGPLRLLIESSRTQQREVPALLYSVNAVWFMASMEDHFRISRSFLPQNGHVIGTNWIFGGGSNRNSSASNLQELQAQVNRSNAHTPEPVIGTSASSQFGQARSESPEPLKEAHTTHNWRHSSGPQGAVIRGPQDGNGFTRLRGESVNTIEISSTNHHLETNPTATSDNDAGASNPQRSDEDETPPDEEDGKL
jgi:Presenilin